jgi:hypothetical protein
MSRYVKNLESPPEVDVERILQLVQPDKKGIDQCQRDARDAIRMIAMLPPFMPPGTIKKQLAKIVAKLQAACEAIDELPREWRSAVPGKELARICGDIDELNGRFLVAKRSGGGRLNRRAAIQGKIAAEQAFDLLNDYGRRVPTSTRRGKYCQITALLIEIATGRQVGAESVERACARIVAQNRRTAPK